MKYLFQLEYALWIIIGYIVISGFLLFLNNKINNKVFNYFVQFFCFPITLITIIIVFVVPVLVTQLNLYFYFIFSFAIPYILYETDVKYEFLNLNIETWIYIILTIGSITAVALHKQLSYLTFKANIFTFKKSDKEKRSELIEICNYIISKINIKLTIYCLFLIALLLFNFLNLEGKSFYENPNIDKAILQSFVTFVAFERLTANLSKTKFRPTNLLRLLISSFSKEGRIITGKKD